MKEFLIFRGFTSTLQTFESELQSDVSSGFKVDRILDLIFKVYVPRFDADKLVRLFAFLNTLFLSSADMWLQETLKKLEDDVRRYYIVHALQKDRPDRVLHFFELYGEYMLRVGGDDWPAWFALPYMKNPSTNANFQVYFSAEWLETLQVSLHNFLCEVFEGIRLPSLLKFGEEKEQALATKKELELLRKQNSELRESLKSKEDEISNLRRPSPRASPLSSSSSFKKLALDFRGSASSSLKSNASLKSNSSGKSFQGIDEEIAKVDARVGTSGEFLAGQLLEGNSLTKWHADLHEVVGVRQRSNSAHSSYSEPEKPVHDRSDSNIVEGTEEVTVQYQETFSGHTSPITRCRYSASGANIASASADGTVRIWQPDVTEATSRSATITTGAQVLSLEWDLRSDRLLLLGTSERHIKAWNAEAKRLVGDLTTEAMFPRVLDIKCSPTDNVFCCAAASELNSSGEGKYGLGYGSLTIWNMRTWKAMTSLSLGEEPPVMTSVRFNHNGKLLAAGASDGMIRIFDMKGHQPITRWTAHDGCGVSCVQFGQDQSSIFTLGTDGKLVEWSLHNQGQILQSVDASAYCALKPGVLPRHEFAIDSTRRHVLLTSNTNYAPLYEWGSSTKETTLEHTAAITSVDWHPSLPMFLTGSENHAVRITAIG